METFIQKKIISLVAEEKFIKKQTSPVECFEQDRIMLIDNLNTKFHF